VSKYRVVNLRTPGVKSSNFVYVGRANARSGLVGHPLASPFTLPKNATAADREDSLAKYGHWFLCHPDRDKLLAQLRLDTDCGRIPMACWCTTAEAGETPIVCHVQIIANELEKRYPEETK